MPAPLIGITTYGADGDPAAFSLPRAYVDAVANAGGRALLLSPAGLAAEDALGLVDGLIIAGGGDLDPASYAGSPHDTVYMVDAERDAFELGLVEAALERTHVPVLGICRGMQVLNIALGGDLDPHLPDVYGEQVVHRLPPRKPTLHPVEVDASGPLFEIYQEREFPVCSWHHQAVRRLGKGLSPVARAADGVIEGLVHGEHPFMLGVQWHPEMQVENDPLQRRIFQALVERAAQEKSI